MYKPLSTPQSTQSTATHRLWNVSTMLLYALLHVCIRSAYKYTTLYELSLMHSTNYFKLGTDICMQWQHTQCSLLSNECVTTAQYSTGSNLIVLPTKKKPKYSFVFSVALLHYRTSARTFLFSSHKMVIFVQSVQTSDFRRRGCVSELMTKMYLTQLQSNENVNICFASYVYRQPEIRVNFNQLLML